MRHTLYNVKTQIGKTLHEMDDRKGGRKVANVFDVAKYILEKRGTMSAMKLQKLCYYAQVWSLVWDDAPLFDEEFEAWANGPVCRELFYKTKGKYSVSAADETGGNNDLTANEKDTIDQVIEHYGKHNAQWLSQLTHMEAPWNEARTGIPAGEGCNRIITKESMALYYGGL